MIQVINKNQVQGEFIDLNAAMEFAKSLNEFVQIKSDEYEILGKFGTDSVENVLLPDGSNYEWKKRRR